LVILSLIILVIHLPGALTTPLEFAPRSSDQNFAPGKRGAVASESSICSRHGTKILELGGNAADAVSLPSKCAN
jgi:gamma-glutamyltranspeptidase/glutathione hydrolase